MFEDTKGVIIVRTSKDRLQRPKAWRYQRGNNNGFWLPLWYLPTLGHCSLSLIDVRIMITPLVSSNFWPHRRGTDCNCRKFEDTKGVIRNRTSLKDRLQWPKVWRYQRSNQNRTSKDRLQWPKDRRYQRGNHNPYIQTFGHCSLFLIDVRTMNTPLVSSNLWPW
jgi:hypothetical protein